MKNYKPKTVNQEMQCQKYNQELQTNQEIQNQDT